MGRMALTYRWIVLLLAAFYFVDRFAVETYSLDEFGWQFRYLTIWALSMSLVSAAMMTTRTFGRRDGRGSVFVSLTATVNMIVVVSYWRLYLDDPALVSSGRPIAAYREYYLHLAGPLLQWIDALFIKRAVHRLMPTILYLGALVVVYLAWAEGLVAPFNEAPVGDVTTGLPYPFLNDMTPSERAQFYLATFVSGVVFAALLGGAQTIVNRLMPRPKTA
jgi:hypothetical protein